MVSGTRLAVLGQPIVHSKSPLLHAAAYAALGLDWQYDRVEMSGEELASFILSRDSGWRGLSLTMPLKRDVLPVLSSSDSLVTLTGAANTVLFEPGAPGADGEATRTIRGFNTDVHGVTQALREAGLGELRRVQLLGAGATAASIVVAVAELGAREIAVLARTAAKAAPLVSLGDSLGVEVTVHPLEVLDGPAPDLVASALPGSVDSGVLFDEATRRGAVLFDVAYDPWPSTLAVQWLQVDGTVVSGLEMLLHQALAQVRIFVTGSPVTVLPNEASVLAAMRGAVA
ncbi:shikimate dehydrogenase [Glaciihabitans arcticus]|uniref:Shikimate dehydrogenase n=1 Tax=Glaciihabitans arcticus TaxID=2668039 RepID=A0A4Q9GPY4_9MICO|nr:shikimate dehydrogenase [Glaciihabitans arcticus]TBN56771.1 shikimate dehydrogenase [Glaciihabitans arcticus]